MGLCGEHCEFLGFKEEVGLWGLEDIDERVVATVV